MESIPVPPPPIQPEVINPSPPPFPQPKPNRLLLIVSIMLLCVFLGGIGVLAYQKYVAPEPIMTAPLPTPTRDPGSTPEPIPLEIGANDWKTYTNTAYQYSVQYPSGWQTGIGDNGATTNFFLQPSDQDYISITVQDNPKSTEIHQWLIDESIIPDPNTISTHIQESNVVIAGIQSVKLTTPTNGGQISVYIPKGNKVFSIYNNVQPNSSQGDYDQNLLKMNQILSTFRFIEPTTETEIMCGGIAGKQCPAGYICQMPANYPDASGTCIKKTLYTCPPSGYVDCMPSPNAGVKYECTPEAFAWFRANCPDFKGGAL